MKDSSNNSTVATAVYTLKPTAPTFSHEAGTYDAAINVAINSAAGTTVYYTLDGSTPTSASTEYTGAIPISTTKTIKAIAVKANWTDSDVSTAEFTIVDPIASATLPFSWAGGSSSGLLSETGVIAYGLGSDYGSSHDPYYVKLDGTGDWIQVKTDSQPSKVTIGVKKIGGATNSTITVKASADGSTFDEGEALTISGATNAVVNLETTRSFGSDVRYVRLVFTKESNVGVGPIGITKYTTAPIINAPATINLSSTDINNEFDYTITNPTGATLSASSTDDWISIINVTSTNVTFETTQNTNPSDSRTGHITLAYTGADDQIVEIIQSKVDYATLPLVFDGKKADLPTGFTQTGLGSDYASSPYLKFDNEGDALVLKINEAAIQLHFDVKSNSSKGTFKVQTSDDGTSYSDLDSYTYNGNEATTTKTYALASSVRYIKWIYTERTSGNVALGHIRVSANSHDIFLNNILNNLTISAGNTYTVYSPAVLTLTGTTTNAAADLVIKDGAQLIHTADVDATMEKNITGYAKGGSGWYTIASPVDGFAVGTLTDGTYDLYSYDEANHLWYNQEAHTGDFTTLSRGTGYLYANSSAKTVSFAGSMKATNAEVTVPLSWASDVDALKGFNLVGNPFTRNLTSGEVTLNGSALTTYYVIENGSEWVTRNLTSNPIKPGQGFLVQATDASQNLVFNPSAKGETATKPAFICIEAGNESFMDCAYVQIGQGNTLRKMTMNENVPHVYVMNNGKDYAAATIENATGEIPVGFNAAYDGIYTINVNSKGLEADYLHLVDKVTGADIDLLTTPSYSFEANTGNNANRFRLVFAANDVDEYSESTNFAYFNGSEWVITTAKPPCRSST